MERHQRPSDAKTDAESTRRQADPFARADHMAQAEDPFADLLQLSFPDGLPKTLEVARGARDTTVASSSAGPQLVSSVRKPVASIGEGASWDGSMDPLQSSKRSLAAKKKKSQESREKRDNFLDQMSSFLEGIESNAADVGPPEPPATLASTEDRQQQQQQQRAQPSPSKGPGRVADKQSLWSSTARDGASSGISSTFPSSIESAPLNPMGYGAGGYATSLMREDVSAPAEDPFHPAGPSSTPTVIKGVDRGRIMDSVAAPHPRGSLFDDDVSPQDEAIKADAMGQSRGGGFLASGSVEPRPQRVTPSPRPFSVPPQDSRGSSRQARSKNKKRPSRGLDLEEVRRRTSLLSGATHPTSSPTHTPAPSLPAAPVARQTPSNYDMGWRPKQEPTSTSFSGRAQHPLHGEPSDPLFAGGGGSGGTFDDRGNYFNEDLLLARAQGSNSGGLEPPEDRSRREGVAWGGEALMDSAGSFLNTARDGAKTLLRDAKAGAGAVGAGAGASWQNNQGQSRQGFERNGTSSVKREQPREFQPRKIKGDAEYEVTFGEGRLGFTLYREETGPNKGKGVVCRVHPNSTAQTLGVQLGDTVCGVNKRRYDTYDEVMKMLPKLTRPVLISFSRESTGPLSGSQGGLTAAARRASVPSEEPQGGGNPLEWLAKLNPFDKQKADGEDGLRDERRNSLDVPTDGKVSSSHEYGLPGEVFAKGLAGGIFSWSYYGTSDGIEANTRDTYTEHVMRCRWGRTAETMQSWMVARRYREFDALDLDLRDAYPDRKDALPRLPPKEFFKMAPDVVERRTKGLEMYMTTIIRRFPDMLESSQLDRFLTISERLSGMNKAAPPADSRQTLSYRNLGTHGSSSNVYVASESMDSKSGTGSSGLVGTDYILNLMSSEEAYRLSQGRRSDPPVDVGVVDDLIGELEDHLLHISPSAHLLSDAKLYDLVEQCQRCWPRIKATAAAAVSGEVSGNVETLLPRVLQCDEGMERAFEHLRAALASRGYIGDAS